MIDKRASLKRALLMVFLLMGAALACNAPTREDATTPVEESETPERETPAPEGPEEETTAVSPATVGPRITATEAVTAEETTLPTFTPIDVAPTLKVTPTSSRTPIPRATNTLRPQSTNQATDTPDGLAGPLTFDYNITWQLKDPVSMIATATVTIRARGGGGGYRYFRDQIEVDGPVFTYEWTTCSGNPGSLRVDSADGQSLKVDYFVHPWPTGPLPCPTPTPTR